MEIYFAIWAVGAAITFWGGLKLIDYCNEQERLELNDMLVGWLLATILWPVVAVLYFLYKSPKVPKALYTLTKGVTLRLGKGAYALWTFNKLWEKHLKEKKRKRIEAEYERIREEFRSYEDDDHLYRSPDQSSGYANEGGDHKIREAMEILEKT